MSRISVDDWAMSLAIETSKRSTCLRRHVGCVLLNSKNHVLATGYNGVARGQPHCNDDAAQKDIFMHSCSGAFYQSGMNLDGCEAIHAEQNALLQCHNVDEIATCYTTTAPCVTCAKLLMNTTCSAIHYLESYSHPEAEAMWLKTGRIWKKIYLQDISQNVE